MIDWGRVSDLRSEIGPDDFDEVVALFLEEADEVIAQLADNPAPSALQDRLHFLKGSALNLGFQDLAQLCQVGERRAAVGDAVDLRAVIAVYAASLAEFTALRDAMAA